MKLISISITNFRSFRGEQTFKFPETPGLYFMQGVNLAEPRLEANGAGKTTLWEALTWCFFGKTSRGLKAGDVCNWDAGKGTSVSIVFQGKDDNLSMQKMTRTWGPISWNVSDLFGNLVDLTKEQSNTVLDELRLDFAPFLNCILTAQGQPMFLDLKADSKASLFSDVMGLDRWLDYSGRASKQASAQDSISRGFERELASLKGRLEGLTGQDFSKSLDTWEQTRTNKLDKLEDEYALTIKALASLKEQLKSINTNKADSLAPRDLAREALNKAKNHRLWCSDALGEARAIKLVAESKHKDAVNDLKTMDKGLCPTCGQDVGKKHSHVGTVSVDSLLARCQYEAEFCATALSALEEAESKEKKAEDSFIKIQDWIDEAQIQVKNHDRSIQVAERSLDQLEDDVEVLDAEANPYAKLMANSLRDLSHTRASIVDTQRLLDDSHHRHSLASFWVRGFKELRLQEIGEALNELEIEVNSCVTSLGLVDWELKFQVDRETKGGSIQRGFNVLVGSPHNQKPVPWESWSGGEAQRLRVAANMGLANLIRARSGCLLELEVWDEPSNGLSQQGIKDLLEALAARARNEARVIFVVDHTAHNFGQFAGGATITKTTAGSVISQY